MIATIGVITTIATASTNHVQIDHSVLESIVVEHTGPGELACRRVGVWEAATERGVEVTFEAGQPIVHQGDTGHRCYAIVDGEALVTAVTAQGANVVLARRGPGSVIGEFSALDGAARSATVRAIGRVTAISLTGDEFEQLLLDRPDIAVESIRRLSRQLRSLTERYSSRGDELRSRVVQVLVTNASETGDRVFRSTREEFAGWVGATREAVTRVLTDLERDGVVALRRGEIELLRVAT